jgi:[acyl-carrier-protein] S-malonyltransferase
MGRDLCGASDAARRVYDECSEVLGWKVLGLGTDDAAEEAERLSRTLYAQPAIVVLSLAAFAALEERMGTLEGAFAGFSLGEYAALAASGVLSQVDAVRLVAERSRLMQEEAERSPGAMYAVLGLEDDAVERICTEVTTASPDRFVLPVNYNCPGQLVVAGHEEAAAEAAERLKAAGAARVIRLAVNGAFHTPMMEPAAQALSRFARTLAFRAPRPGCVLYSNTTGEAVAAGTDMPAYLARHMTSPVRWRSELTAMAAAGCTSFVESGPGKVLCGLVRKTLPGARTWNVEDARSLDSALVGLNGA